MQTRVSTGLERCIDAPPRELAGARFGLLMNQASVDGNCRYACDVLAERFPGQLVALFSPQHGFWGEQQANMIESGHARYEPLDLPLFSLYSETHQPTAAMLNGADCLVIDLQDVGTRVYTFVWTMLECLRACAEYGVRVLVLDRPNPLGGEVFEGPMLQPAFRSFVGGAQVPLRHGLTMGELARFLNEAEGIQAELSVVPMAGWQRSMTFAETGLPWVAPSPNMPRPETAMLYPGMVLLEGTNLSEGRGTTLPFELCGAPYIAAEALVGDISRHGHPGVRLRPVRFRPTFDKWQNETCQGVSIHIVDPREVRSVRLAVSIIDAARRIAPNEFRWLGPPYEYEPEQPPIDILFGGDALRKRLESPAPLGTHELDALTFLDAGAWLTTVLPFLIYNP